METRNQIRNCFAFTLDCNLSWLEWGFRPVAVVRKERTIYHCRREGYEVEVTLDTLEGLGPFVEVEIRAEEARPQDAVDLAEAHAAAKLAGAARVLAQGEFLDAEGHQRFLQLERDDPGVAVRHGAVRPGAIVG